MAKTRIPANEDERRRQNLIPTPRQAQILECLRAHKRDRGYAATRAELARDTNGAQNAIDHQLKQLTLKGWIEVTPGVQRGIVLLREGAPIVEAGTANTLEEYDPDIARIGTIEELLGKKPDLYVKVMEPMSEAGLAPGNIVAVTRNGEPDCNGVVAVRREGKIELKRCEETRETDEIIGVATHAVMTLGGT